jgi:peptidoglycan/LPS O-acetylase OafA/YrhL
MAWVWSIAGLGIQSAGVTESPAKLAASYLVVGLGCGFLLYGCLGIPPSWSPRVLVYLGKISYGLYVFHVLCLLLSKAAIDHMESSSYFFRTHHLVLRPVKDCLALGLTILLASLSYRYYESYFLLLKERFTFVRSRSV